MLIGFHSDPCTHLFPELRAFFTVHTQLHPAESRQLCFFVPATMADEEHTDLKEVPELAPFDPTKKKKKKKVVIQDIVEESVDKLTEKTESLSVADGAESSFLGLKKKKKKPVETKLLNEEIGDGEEEAALKRLNSTTIRIHRFDGNTKFAPPIKE
ncbi:hypothetical protein LINPERHAP2_LOCUS35831 [Linum perenne]